MAAFSAWGLDFSTRNRTDVRLLAQNDDVRARTYTDVRLLAQNDDVKALNWENVPTPRHSERNEGVSPSEVEESRFLALKAYRL